MAAVPSCTQYNNYGPRQIHVSGIKTSAYTFTRNGVRYANGQTYVGDGTAEQPPSPPLAVSTPNCRTCHSGC
ncbi:MAG TPA: hypothetical protein VMW91_05300 [Desulfosporosinus sp.]|nr:hypothetical protein [Desulfosporosinus sp.]